MNLFRDVSEVRAVVNSFCFAFRTLQLHALGGNSRLGRVKIVVNLARVAYVGVNESFHAAAAIDNPTRRRHRQRRSRHNAAKVRPTMIPRLYSEQCSPAQSEEF